jgi:hypothetical protein
MEKNKNLKVQIFITPMEEFDSLNHLDSTKTCKIINLEVHLLLSEKVILILEKRKEHL